MVAQKIFVLDCILQALHPGNPVPHCFCEITRLLSSIQVGCKVNESLLELGVEAGLDVVKHALQLIGVELEDLVVGWTKWVHKKGEPKLTLQMTEHAVQAKHSCLQCRRLSVSVFPAEFLVVKAS